MTDLANYQNQEEEKLDDKTIDEFKEILQDGIADLVPGMGTANKLYKLIKNYQIRQKEILEQERMNIFHNNLIANNLTTAEAEKALSSSDHQKDYLAILNYVLEEDEEEKIQYYAKLYRYLVLKILFPDFKKKLIKIFKELSRSDFEVLENIYTLIKAVQKTKGMPQTSYNYNEKPEHKLYKYFEDIPKDTLNNIAIQKLKSLAILDQPQGSPHPKETQLLMQIGEIIE